MLLGIDGFMVEYDAEGHDDWRFCAFFAFWEDAVKWANDQADEPTRYRISPSQQQKVLAA